MTLCLFFFFTGFFPGQTEDHREHGPRHEASEPAAAAGEGQAVDETSALALTTRLSAE